MGLLDDIGGFLGGVVDTVGSVVGDVGSAVANVFTQTPVATAVDLAMGDPTALLFPDLGGMAGSSIFDAGALDLSNFDLGGLGDVVGGLSALGGSTAAVPRVGGGRLIQTGGTMMTDTGEMIPTMGAGVGLALRGMSQVVAGAILKLKQVMGGGGFLTASGIGAFGARTWSALTAWAAKNPSMSVISLLVSLGLTVEEAAHFLAWGSTHKRRRRHRGISYRDMRTTRRTMGRVISMSQQLRSLCGGVTHRTYGGHRHRVTNLPRRH